MADDKDNELLPVVEPRATPFEPEDPASPKVGRWYHVHDASRDWRDGDKSWLGCVVHLGSNYVELQSVGGGSRRIHGDVFWDHCQFVPEPEILIQREIDTHQKQVLALLREVREITARLGVAESLALPSANSEVRALAVRTDQPMEEYKTALVLAQKKTLPGLFKQIEEESKSLSEWMSATLIPMKAQVASLTPAIEAIENRIFNVQLYAGLSEEVEQIAEGEPAAREEKLHIFQRRAYMDEECLAAYQTGGMEFKNLKAFDRWIAKRRNMDRLLPFPRCLIAFQVRRNDKFREVFDARSLIQMMEDAKLDKLTFLYIRNGAQLFRLSTAVEFEEKLFPDIDHHLFDGRQAIYARQFVTIDGVISENEYKGMVEKERQQEREIADKQRAAEKLPKKQRPQISAYVYRRSEDYIPFTKESVHYDDIASFIQEQLAKHNRLVLVLQGLLDRSPVLHPHPPWSLWDKDFDKAIDLIYDDSRALTAGDKPDFETYRARCNASLAVGGLTVGQEDYWLVAEGTKESAKRRARSERDHFPTRYRPEGNPGPGVIARVATMGRGVCHYEWVRTKKTWRRRERVYRDMASRLKVPVANLLNVEAYKPGDFHLFFDDPRTRADYLQWAPLLLEAEEYHAGNREVPPKKPMPPPQPRIPGGSPAYRKRKALLALVGKAVRLVRDITTMGGTVHKKGSLWRVNEVSRGALRLVGILKNGQREPPKVDDDGSKDHRYVGGVPPSDFVVDETIPAAPKNE